MVSIGAVPDRHSVTRRRARGRGLSTTVTAADDSLRVQDGPFADTKEQLSRTLVIDVPDLDTALKWTGEAPAVRWGTVQVRPGAVRYPTGAWVPNA